MIKRFSYPVLAAFFAICALAAASAEAASDVDTEYTSTTIVSEEDGFTPGATVWFALHQEIRDGWHVFWKNPGDAGLTLALDWTLPAGFETGDIFYPAPHYIPVGPLASYAHEGDPVFLIPVTAPADAVIGDMIDVTIDASWQVCEEICVPEEAQFTFSMALVADAAVNEQSRALFDRARRALPAASDFNATIARRGAEFELSISGWTAADATEVFFFPAPEGLTTPAAPQTAVIKEGVMTVALTPGWTTDIDADAVDGVIAYADRNGVRQAVDITAKIDGSLAPAGLANTPAASNIAVLLLLAFFGGLILNIMPCVFPIIFVKAAALMQSAHEDRAAVRAHGLFYTGGVLATFVLMGGVLLALRAGGEQLGWGFHLQSPMVVALSAYILFLVGLNLSGVFSVGEGLAGGGQNLAAKGGAAGAFFTGALAVVVAAPCIGPLLSAPMGAALLLPAGAGMLIFVVMALGLAAPYLALSLAPGLGRLLPKPGAWMIVFKQALAFPVFAAAGYFLWVFSRQTGDNGLAMIIAGAVLLALAAWLFELSKGDGPRALVLRGLSAAAVVLAIAPVTRIEPAPAAAHVSGAYGAIVTEAYSGEQLAAYRASGTPVFIDFTAAWCVTCQFNKLTALKNDEVAAAFKRSGTVFMVADWTVRDPEITAALQSYGASGVPLYVYYPPRGPAQILPQTLSRQIVLNAISGASMLEL